MALEPGIRYEGGDNLEVMREAVNYNRFLKALISRFAEDMTAVLDFGAGIGTFSDSLPIPRSHVTCVEPDVEAQTQLTGMGFVVHPRLSAIEDHQYSYVFTLNVLEHIADDGATVAELYRVLKPGGRLFVYVPAFALLYSAMDAKVGHHRRYRMTELTNLLRSAGFQIEQRAYTDALGFLAAVVYKLVDRRASGVLNKNTVRFYDRYLFPVSRLLSVPLARVLGKNLYVVAGKPRVSAS
ncbi:MAG: class I SAM-dependent methyltransferase [Acidiferrobacteraceae bacterium]